MAIKSMLSFLFRSVNLFLICLKFQSPTKMGGRLIVQKRAQLAPRYEVWRSVVKCKGGGEPLKEDMLKLTLRRSRIVMKNSSPQDLRLILEEAVALPIPKTRM